MLNGKSWEIIKNFFGKIRATDKYEKIWNG